MKFVRLSELPTDIQQSIIDYHVENRLGAPPFKMPLDDALRYFLEWEGIIGYTDRILTFFDKAEQG